MRIFCADDEKLSLENIVNIVKEIEGNKAEVLGFSTGKQLIEAADEKAPDIVFLDIEMGSMSGIEIARDLKILKPNVNIIFVTGYEQYMGDAFKIHSSGYVTKPFNKERIREELKNLRNPIDNEENDGKLTARCFGNFDASVNGKSLDFDRSKSKEMLAYLVDRRGCFVTSGELRAVLWEDAEDDLKTNNYFQQIKRDLIATLKKAGVEDALLSSWNKYAIDTKKIHCDYYDFLAGKPEGLNAYNGEYMSEYSWGDINNDRLSQKVYGSN